MTKNRIEVVDIGVWTNGPRLHCTVWVHREGERMATYEGSDYPADPRPSVRHVVARGHQLQAALIERGPLSPSGAKE